MRIVLRRLWAAEPEHVRDALGSLLKKIEYLLLIHGGWLHGLNGAVRGAGDSGDSDAATSAAAVLLMISMSVPAEKKTGFVPTATK